MSKGFNDFNLSVEVLNAISEMGFEEPTAIQKSTIPPAMEGFDVIGQAQTGTGKTVAFGIPVIEKGKRGKIPYAIILTPTRELAVQVAKELNRIGKNKGILSVPIYGGQPIEKQIGTLKKGVDIVVGTPGRVIDHIKRKTLVLKNARILVIDEGDEMLNMGFVNDIERIIKELPLPAERQTMLFSATLPDEIMRIASKYMNNPKEVSVDSGNKVVQKIKQVFYEVSEGSKISALTTLLNVGEQSLTLVFCHTKREVDRVYGKLQKMGYIAGAIHGDFRQSHRDSMMDKFKRGDIEILVATDVAARGLDIPDISHVVNYNIPQDPNRYIHRIGRTGRAGRTGMASTFVTPGEHRQLSLIERSAKTRIHKGKLPESTPGNTPGNTEVKKEATMGVRSGYNRIEHKKILPMSGSSYKKRRFRSYEA